MKNISYKSIHNDIKIESEVRVIKAMDDNFLIDERKRKKFTCKRLRVKYKTIFRNYFISIIPHV
jgi:hypothetical protein